MSPPLVITGMHRSGTSLVASSLSAAGLDIGRALHPAGIGNPRGHFEDQDFFTLHEEMLAARGVTALSAGEGFAPPSDRTFAERARSLVAARSALPAWGFKDPRTCLFLEFWDALLPEARYLFVYRHPVEVGLSLWRRDTDLELRRRPRLAIAAWELYNRRLLDFAARHPERTFVAHVGALTADFSGFVRALDGKLGLALAADEERSTFAPDELISWAPGPAWSEAIPEALDVYRRLESSADLPLGATAQRSPRPSAREAALERTCEALLRAVLDGRPGDAAEDAPPPSADERLAYFRRRADQEAIAALEAARAADWEWIEKLHDRADAAERALAGIETSWSFAPVRAWWWLRGRFRR